MAHRLQTFTSPIWLHKLHDKIVEKRTEKKKRERESEKARCHWRFACRSSFRFPFVSLHTIACHSDFYFMLYRFCVCVCVLHSRNFPFLFSSVYRFIHSFLLFFFHTGKAVPFVELTVAHASVLTILAISFERYYAICEPLKAGYVCTKTRALMICLAAWAVAAIFTR